MYPIEIVAPMARELTENGFKSLSTAEEVVEMMSKQSGTSLLVVNSVCGCAAAHARPGARLAMQHEAHPDHAYTVFAGVDKEATAKAREYLFPYPPSSPSMALFKDGKLVHFIERHNIEGHSARQVAENLISAFDEHCQ